MNSKEIKIEDESGDKKYFTIVPNIILNHSTANAQALYLQLKRLAGENGVACCGQRYLKKQLGMAHNTIKKEFEYLLKKGWIKYNGEKDVMTDGGMQKMKSYKIVDLWNINVKEYQNQHTLNTKGYQNKHEGVSNEAHRGVKISTKEEQEHKNTTIAKSDEGLFSFKEELKKMDDNPRLDIQLVSYFFQRRGLVFNSKAQLQVALKRHLPSAGDVSKFGKEKVFKAMDECDELEKNKGIKWSLETVVKYLTK